MSAQGWWDGGEVHSSKRVHRPPRHIPSILLLLIRLLIVACGCDEILRQVVFVTLCLSKIEDLASVVQYVDPKLIGVHITRVRSDEIVKWAWHTLLSKIEDLISLRELYPQLLPTTYAGP